VILRGFLRGVAGLVTGVGLYLGAAALGGVIGNGAPAMAPTNDLYRVGLIIGPVHTDLLIPLTPYLRARMAFAAEAGVPVGDPGAEWLIVGWGAEEFYTTVGAYSDLTAQAVWSGITGDASVLRVDVAGRIGDFEGIDLLALTPDQFGALTDAVLETFERDAAGAPVALDAPGFTFSDAFFRAQGGFHLFRTCNVWVSNVMARAGVPFGRWTPTPYAVRLAVWRFGPDG
jgi:uncharacterized protein (TIGR02117 family)